MDPEPEPGHEGKNVIGQHCMFPLQAIAFRVNSKRGGGGAIKRASSTDGSRLLARTVLSRWHCRLLRHDGPGTYVHLQGVLEHTSNFHQREHPLQNLAQARVAGSEALLLFLLPVMLPVARLGGADGPLEMIMEFVGGRAPHGPVWNQMRSWRWLCREFSLAWMQYNRCFETVGPNKSLV